MRHARGKALMKTNFNFSGCIKISDFGLKSISLGLKEFVNLQEVSLEFDGCPKITRSGENRVKKELRKNERRSLKRAEVSFRGRSEEIEFGPSWKKWMRIESLLLILLGIVIACLRKIHPFFITKILNLS